MLSVKYFSTFCFICYLVLMGSFQRVYGQAEAAADQYFAADQFYKAAVLYEQIYQSDTTDYRIAFQLGECYRHLFKYEKAQHYYHLARTYQSRRIPLSVFYYALMLKYNQHFEEAIREFDTFMEHFSTSVSDTYLRKAKNEKQGCYLALLEQRYSAKYFFFRLGMPVNTEYSDYGPAIFRFDSLLVITSSRIKSKSRINNQSGEGFTDNLMFEKTASGWEPVGHNQNFNITNSRWGDGSGCFNQENNKYYFTSCGVKDGFCHIYVSVLKDGRWQAPVALNSNINQKDTNTKHPAVTAGGDTLFFVSDRPGGYGGTDIWMSISSGDDLWGPPVLLGKEINSPFNEITPFYEAKEKLLLFASDGHEGMGGMDIFLAEELGQKTATVQNLGKPFNSSKDDCYLVLGERLGYLASNRKESFDIYRFDKQRHLSTRDFLLGNFGDPLPVSSPQVYQQMITDAGIDFPMENENTISVRSSEKEHLRNGSTRFILSSDVDDIWLDKFRKTAQLEQEQATDTFLFDVADPELDSFPAYVTNDYPLLTLKTNNMVAPQKGEVSGRLFQAENDSVLSAVTLHLVTSEGAVAKITTTNQEGAFRFLNLESDAVYHVFAEESSVPPDTEIQARNVQLQAYGEEVNAFRYENIYFDFNQAYLRKEARVVLDELAEFYRQHPQIQIEINAFTDSTGNADYNLLLSQERGQSAFDYLIEKGVDRSAIVINAQGVSTSTASTNSFVSQQLNRRVEFEVIGKGIIYQPRYETRILRPKITMEILAEELNMSLEELMQINGLTQKEIQAFKPIRVRKSAAEGEELLFYDIIKK